MPPYKPVPAGFYSHLAASYAERLRAIRALMPDDVPGSDDEEGDARACNAEWGAFCETGVRHLLRSLMPGRFGVVTGHIATGTGPLTGTPPLDVIVYDALHYPVVHSEGELAVVPPEAARLVIEVKASLVAGTFRDALGQLARARDALERRREELSKTPEADKIGALSCFVLGFSGSATGGIWDFPECRGFREPLTDIQRGAPLDAVLSLEHRKAMIVGAPRDAFEGDEAFPFWYWHLVHRLYADTGLVPPVPQAYIREVAQQGGAR